MKLEPTGVALRTLTKHRLDNKIALPSFTLFINVQTAYIIAKIKDITKWGS